jgi:hypothetical protein
VWHTNCHQDRIKKEITKGLLLLKHLPLLNAHLWWDKRSAARVREVGGALLRSVSLAMGELRKRDRHRTSTKFRLGAIRYVHQHCKRPSYMFNMFQNRNKMEQKTENRRRRLNRRPSHVTRATLTILVYWERNQASTTYGNKIKFNLTLNRWDS